MALIRSSLTREAFNDFRILADDTAVFITLENNDGAPASL